MSYKVINKFIDKDDNNTLYNVGDVYPKGDLKLTEKRIELLTNEHPVYKCRFIQEVDEQIEETPKAPVKKKATKKE